DGVWRWRVVRGVGVHQALQLPAVEEDPPALGALVDGDAAALVRPHRALALRAGQVHDLPNAGTLGEVPRTTCHPRRGARPLLRRWSCHRPDTLGHAG